MSIPEGPMNSREKICINSIEALHLELEELQTQYMPYLKQQSLQGEVDLLTRWLESYKLGSKEAAEYLHDHGAELLHHIKTELKSAGVEMQHIDEESPNSKNFSGGKVDRLHKATALTVDAEEKLEAILKEDTKH